MKKINTHHLAIFVSGLILLSILTSALTTITIFTVRPVFMQGFFTKKPYERIMEHKATKIISPSEETVEDVVAQVKPTVVSIIIKKNISTRNNDMNDLFNLGNPFNFKFFFFGDDNKRSHPNQNHNKDNNNEKQKRKIGGGTGFFISEDGLILTNRHVVEDKNAEYVVVNDDGIEYEAEVKAIDPFFDLAIIKVDGNNFSAIPLGDSDKLRIGQTVLAVGNALAEFGGTVTKGIISAKERSTLVGDKYSSNIERLEGVLQTDTSINPGNSGGPLINLAGEAIGINTAIANSAEGIGFAIPINDVKAAVKSYLKKGKIIRPQLGLRYRMITESLAEKNNLNVEEGALVIRGNDPDDLAVIPGGPADKAGIEENDIILEVNGEKVDQNHSLTRLIQKHAVNDNITMKVIHDGKEKEITVVLEESMSKSDKDDTED